MITNEKFQKETDGIIRHITNTKEILQSKIDSLYLSLLLGQFALMIILVITSYQIDKLKNQFKEELKCQLSVQASVKMMKE